MPPAITRPKRTAQGYREPLLKVVDGLLLELVPVPGGRFTMGSPEDEPERFDREGPQHAVEVSGFLMGRYPVTQAQWRAVAALDKVKRDLKANPSRFEGNNHPVEQVSWLDAEEFCARLAQHTGRPYRLPTEAEWEYACRAGTETPFYFGNTITDELANYHAPTTYNGGPKGKYRNTTIAVNELGLANRFGLSGMHGNVSEWCADHYHETYEGAPKDGSAWVDENAEENKKRVRRGGSWNYYPRYCRSAYRNYISPGNRNPYIGFRVSCSAPRALT
ncbi:MAG: formylglycine-generating enzyme family protein [Cyanobacteria bacterium P01_F01_bin.86]